MNKIILLNAIVGSQAYGTNTPDSDIDTKGVYLQDPMEVLGMEYKEQINLDKDACLYEVRRFLQLLCSGNPTMLELLYIPEDCILEKHPLWDIISKHRSAFLTKQCYFSFAGYAYQQVEKAKRLNKKMNWEADKVKRKSPIDFLKVIDNCKTYPLVEWLKRNQMHEDCCGLAKVNDSENLYALWYDDIKEMSKTKDLSNPRYKDWKDFGYKGVCNDVELLLSEIPEWQIPMCRCNLYYNRNGWGEHCKDYNSYQTWLKERNTQRYVDIQNHGQKIDGKNMLHCIRLLQCTNDILDLKTINVRVKNPEYLLSIRHGKVSLEELLESARNQIKGLKQKFEDSDLPHSVDPDLVKSILNEIRKESLNLF